MLSWALIGVLIGAVLGLTAAGGAIISVPLFMRFCGATLHEATAYAAIAVFTGATMNAWAQRKRALVKLAVVLGVSAVCGAAFAATFKAQTPEFVIRTMFVVVCLYGLWATWNTPPATSQSTESRAATEKRLLKRPWRLVVLGFSLGILVTMTGMGGGLVVVPILLTRLKIPSTHAIPTTLCVTTLSSLAALIGQYDVITSRTTLIPILLLALGTWVAAAGVSRLSQELPARKQDRIRKVGLTAVIGFAVVSVLF